MDAYFHFDPNNGSAKPPVVSSISNHTKMATRQVRKILRRHKIQMSLKKIMSRGSELARDFTLSHKSLLKRARKTFGQIAFSRAKAASPVASKTETVPKKPTPYELAMRAPIDVQALRRRLRDNPNL